MKVDLSGQAVKSMFRKVWLPQKTEKQYLSRPVGFPTHDLDSVLEAPEFKDSPN